MHHSHDARKLFFRLNGPAIWGWPTASESSDSCGTPRRRPGCKAHKARFPGSMKAPRMSSGGLFCWRVGRLLVMGDVLDQVNLPTLGFWRRPARPPPWRDLDGGPPARTCPLRPGGLDGWPVPATRVRPPRRERPSLRGSALRVRRSVLARGVLPAAVAPVPGRGAPAIDKSLRPGATEQV